LQRTSAEESIEDDPQYPGKIVVANINSGDDDGVPGFAEGGRCDGDYLDSNSRFTPMYVDISNLCGNPDVRIKFEFNESSHDMLESIELQHNASCEYHGNDSEGFWRRMSPPRGPDDQCGDIRLWKENGLSESRKWEYAHEIDPMLGGDAIAPGQLYHPASLFGSEPSGILWVEGIHASNTKGDVTIKAKLYLEDNGTLTYLGSDQIRLTVVEIALHDVQDWSPYYDDIGDMMLLTSTDLWYDRGMRSVMDGAIADGTSILLVRMKPSGEELNPDATWKLEVSQDVSEGDPTTDGTLFGIDASPYPYVPYVPTPYPVPEHFSTEITDYSSGLAYYVPPLRVVAAEQDEHRVVQYRITMDATDISSQPLYIRRPPLVLVHGILGSPDESWDDTLWSHNTPTRVYKADWEKDDDGNYTHHKGFIENFGYVARTIEQALRDYRRGSDSKAFTTAHAGVGNNHDFNQMRYAATRADVVAHSQGGLVTRWYIADMELHNHHTNTIERFHPPNNWGSIEVSDRDVYHEGTLWNHISQEWYSRGRWDYLRNDNYHAGAIRRFISIGSPYRGSHLADVAETATKPTTAIETAMRNWVYAHDGAMPASLQAFLFPDGPEGDYSAPTCVVDLMTESWATLFTRQATTYLTSDHAQGYVTTSYPTGPASVYWFGVSSSWSGTTPDDVQVLDVLSQLFAIVGDGNPTSSIIYYSTPTHTWHIRMSAVWQAIGVTNTDGVVPLASQRDADSLSQIKPNIRHYYRHTHYNLPYLPCDYVQKESQWIRNDVIELLYNNDYNGIDLPLIVDDDEIITLLHENKHYIPLVPSQ
jgi:triacylglycerol esterase/lipase EstA (alpha/beta hydrolase family)